MPKTLLAAITLAVATPALADPVPTTTVAKEGVPVVTEFAGA